MVTHEEKINHLKVHLEEEGVSANYAAPPLFRLCWSLGWKALPPPIFLSRKQLILLNGIPFSLFFALFMWLLLWRGQDMSFYGVLFVAIFHGVVFGIFMAHLTRKQADKLDLPSWQEYAKN